MPSLSFIPLGFSRFARSTGIYLALGSNLEHLGNPPQLLLQRALALLNAGGDKLVAVSSIWQSNAWPPEATTPQFFNAACQIQPNDEDPAALLERLHAIEAEFGRQRYPLNQWSARTLDLDLLDYNGLVTENCSFLRLPHPRLHLRDFVLRPLLEIAPDWLHPQTGQLGRDLLLQLEVSGDLNDCHLVQTLDVSDL
ncbi:MAG: 2-amino-4-hydroxy-6-hydroxymethyldihydropteridine pyrophosphokinae [Pseudomonadota bacterium]